MSVSACTANLSSTAVVMLRAWSGLLRRGAVRSDPQAEDITTLRRWPSSTGRWPEHGEFVIKGPRSSDAAPLLLSPMLGKLLVHEKCDFSDGASAGQTGRSPGNWRDPSRAR